MRILVAPDKFKGSLSAAQASAAIETGFRAVFPHLQSTRLPIADGGEGTAAVFRDALGGEQISLTVPDPLGRPVSADYTWLPDSAEAVIDMSAASGLWRLSDCERNPLRTSTRGTGELLIDTLHRGARKVFIGLGGSATNDAGAGLAAALGFRFLDHSGSEIDPVPAHFQTLTRIVSPDALPSAQITALSDVTNPLLGPRGATRIYGPQKGSADLDLLESRLGHFADLVARDLHCDHRETPGAGAAGGLGFGLLSFLQSGIRPGFDACVELLEIERHIAEADLVITAEGRLDPTTAEGKGPGGIARLARAAGKPVIAFAGHLDGHAALHRIFDACIPIAPYPMTLDSALADADILLSHAAERAARLIALSPAV